MKHDSMIISAGATKEGHTVWNNSLSLFVGKFNYTVNTTALYIEIRKVEK